MALCYSCHTIYIVSTSQMSHVETPRQVCPRLDLATDLATLARGKQSRSSAAVYHERSAIGLHFAELHPQFRIKELAWAPEPPSIYTHRSLHLRALECVNFEGTRRADLMNHAPPTFFGSNRCSPTLQSRLATSSWRAPRRWNHDSDQPLRFLLRFVFPWQKREKNISPLTPPIQARCSARRALFSSSCFFL